MTASLISGSVGYDPSNILIHPNLYERGLAAIMEFVHDFEDAWQRVFLIGHNPDMTLIINQLSGEFVVHLPTCGVASIEFAVDAWSDITDGAGRLAFFDYPKRHIKNP